MKVKLKKFPNGAHVVFENVDYIKTASRLKDHFCLVPSDAKPEELTPVLYLHRDTFVEPVTSTTKL